MRIHLYALSLLVAIFSRPLFSQETVSEETKQAHSETDYTAEVPRASFLLNGQASFGTRASFRKIDQSRVYESGARLKLKPEYQHGGFTLYGDIDYFLNSGTNEEIRQSSVIEPVEFYIRGGENLEWCAGKQRFNWGAGDTFQPSNFIDRSDLRASFARDNEDRYTGVWALSLKYLAGDYGVEFALRPLREDTIEPAGFYSVRKETVQSPAGELQCRYAEQNNAQSVKDAAAAIRAGGTSGMFDWHLLYYSGGHNMLLYGLTLQPAENAPPQVEIRRLQRRVNVFGADMSFAVDKFNVRVEGAFSPDMAAVTDGGDTDTTAVMQRVAAGESVAIAKSSARPYAAYTAGFDYNLWGNNGTVYVEWMQARYLRESGVEPVLQSDILVLRLEDKFLDEAVIFSLSSMAATGNGGPGFALNAEAGYDFKTGLSAEAGLWYFIANGNDYIEMLEHKRMLYAAMKYGF